MGPRDATNYPELPLTPEWGRLVRAAREGMAWTQARLATEVGLRQAMISFIEDGSVKTSRAVVPIADLLGIPLPTLDESFFANKLEQRWVNAGRLLARSNRAGFLGLLAAAERMLAGDQDDGG